MNEEQGVWISTWGKYLTRENLDEFVKWANGYATPPKWKAPDYLEPIE